ncbi:hypothetical protein LHT11_08895 [Acetobacter indonesiensis]|uniref:hypothetical protein n=1 Tax=Acetobacter indonesiensis TaxID=104101 RepID=UPI001F326AA3|nr:hypothetical protein [Acetobacter indonesiensis]MCG0995317.1 hypothetical protein [Acetobacter indonesiensis]
MKPKEAMSALDGTLEGIRSMLKDAKQQDKVTIAFCVTVTPRSGDSVQVACGTGGQTRNVAFSISRILREALRYIPSERHAEFRHMVNQMEKIEEKSSYSVPPEVFMTCPDTKLH